MTRDNVYTLHINRIMFYDSWVILERIQIPRSAAPSKTKSRDRHSSFRFAVHPWLLDDSAQTNKRSSPPATPGRPNAIHQRKRRHVRRTKTIHMLMLATVVGSPLRGMMVGSAESGQLTTLFTGYVLLYKNSVRAWAVQMSVLARTDGAWLFLRSQTWTNGFILSNKKKHTKLEEY
jgi:hypothetical protein